MIWQDQIFYHIYPLGLCSAPQRNDFTALPQPRLLLLEAWAAHVQALGATALYLGPVLESSTHGYDTADYYHVDRRLGTDETLAQVVQTMHAHGVRVVLDAVFHHVGRDFWAFRDLQQNGEHSAYRDWFVNVRFDQGSPFGDAFSYDGWNGHHNLVKLNLHNADVRAHLFGAIEHWARAFEIDGLRIDAADYIDTGFLREMSAFCRTLRPDFWLLGEVIHGDYRQWANPEMFDSVTNYQAYKGLYSSLNDHNYHEIAHTLNRQFGDGGMYSHLSLYGFADNHDVTRIASILHNPAHLYPLHVLLFTMPGVPSVYYGSEWGVAGAKPRGEDWVLRPALDLEQIKQRAPQPDLAKAIARMAQIRHASVALRRGSYQQLHVGSEQFAFARTTPEERVVVAVNAADTAARFTFNLPQSGGQLVDVLNGGETFALEAGRATFEVPPAWGRVLRLA